jgi:hypothetical protein
MYCTVHSNTLPYHTYLARLDTQSIPLHSSSTLSLDILFTQLSSSPPSSPLSCSPLFAESLCLAPTALTTNQELWKSGNSMENKTLSPIFVALFTADNIASLTSFLGFIFLNFFVSFTPYFFSDFLSSLS